MRMQIDISCDSAAFQSENGPDPGPEIARILIDLARFIEDYGGLDDKTLQDINGNTVGKARFFGKTA